jgi:hypothetical protein
MVCRSYILVQKGFSLIVLPWIQGNNMKIIINSFDTKPLIRDFNLQPFDPLFWQPSNYTMETYEKLAYSRSILMSTEVIISMDAWNFCPPSIQWKFTLDAWKYFHGRL